MLTPGANYHLAAAVKLPAGSEGTAEIGVSIERNDVAGVDNRWINLTQVDVSADEWTLIDHTFTVPTEPSQMYFETPDAFASLNFLVDSIVVTGQEGEVQLDLLPIMDTVDFPVGVAIDERETTGQAAQLLLHHFNQITAENHMKPENWYDADRQFRIDPQAVVLMDFARDNDLSVYGHTLLWHSQVPQWFFEDEAGDPLTNSEEDRTVLRERMRDHIFNVADALSEWGDYGGENPLVAWDVVNEVISDDAQPDACGAPSGTASWAPVTSISRSSTPTRRSMTSTRPRAATAR